MSLQLNVHHFGVGIGPSERERINLKFNSLKWDKAKSYVSYETQVTRAGIDIANRLHKEYGVTAFPFIHIVAMRGGKGNKPKDGPTFMMFTDGLSGEIYFKESSTKYVVKKSQWYIDSSDPRCYICIR